MRTIAADNGDALLRVKERLETDVGSLIRIARAEKLRPYWAISRMLFPVAESCAFLFYGGEPDKETGPRLAAFLIDQLSKVRPGYKQTGRLICQMWRHAMVHSDETPDIVVDSTIDPGTGKREYAKAKVMTWRVTLGSAAHLELNKLDDRRIQFTFGPDTFYQDLHAFLNDNKHWAGFGADVISDRYNQWAVVFLEGSPDSQRGKAAQEIRDNFARL